MSLLTRKKTIHLSKHGQFSTGKNKSYIQELSFNSATRLECYLQLIE